MARTTHETDRRPGAEALRYVPAALLLAALVAFAVANTENTTVDFIFTDAEAPLIVVLLATAVAGAAIAWLLRFDRRHR